MSYWSNNISKAIRLVRAPLLRHYLNRALWDSGYPWTQLTPTFLNQICPGIDDMPAGVSVIKPFSRKTGFNLELDEMVALLAIVKYTNSQRIVEVGTYDGNTALNLAANVGENGEVFTLDLPPADAARASQENAIIASDAQTAPRTADDFDRRQYPGHPLAGRIRQVYADSATLDWSTLGREFDLAFIDGDHSSRYAASDTRNALSVLKPGGMIVWHDYEYRSVSQVLDAAAAKGDKIAWIKGTRLAVAAYPNPKASIGNYQS